MILLTDTMLHTASITATDPSSAGEEALIKSDEELHTTGYYEEVTDTQGKHLGGVIMEGGE